jgi:cardiolipin synthase
MKFFASIKLFIFAFIILLAQQIASADTLIIEPEMGKQPLLNLITESVHKINLVIYGFTDQTFIQALINAKNSGKDINVLIEPHPYRSHGENNYAIKKLLAAHVKLKFPSRFFKLTHQKTFLLDDNKALIMTFNLTHSTFNHERNFALLTTNPAVVTEIKHIFIADWNHQRARVDQENLIWSPDNSREKFLQLINNAQSEIKIYAQSLTDYGVIGALAKASRHGVNIAIITSESHASFSKRNHPNRKLEFLQRAGVHIRESSRLLIHAKVMIVDRHKAVLGSINFTKPSLDGNRELAIITQDQKVLQQLLQTFALDWGK